VSSSDVKQMVGKGAVATAIALSLSACATTTDPRACRDQGMGSVLSGCANDVAAQTAVYENQTAEILQDTDALTAQNQKAEEEAAALEARVLELKKELEQKSDRIADLQATLLQQRNQNRISQSQYDTLSAKLGQLNDRIDHYKLMDVRAFETKQVEEVESILTADFVSVEREILDAAVS
jgi:septal ring factor EnvC (AmiA/AmiB activator)